MARLRPPDPRITATSAHLIELVTVARTDGGGAMARHARQLTEGQARAVLSLAVGLLADAWTEMAEVGGIDPGAFIEAVGLAIAQRRCDT